MNSICSSAEVKITTRHRSSLTGVCATFSHNGVPLEVISCAREPGTTVLVEKLFYDLPVRSKQLSSNLSKEVSKATRVVETYALMALDCAILCEKLSVSRSKTTLVRTLGTKKIRDNIIHIFGDSQVKSMTDVQGVLDNAREWKVEGFISKPDSSCGRTSGDRQFTYVNSRPFESSRISRCVNSVFKNLSSRWACSVKFPVFFLNFLIPQSTVDFNLTPDKRTHFIVDEKLLVEKLRILLEKTLEPLVSEFNLSCGLSNPRVTNSQDSPGIESFSASRIDLSKKRVQKSSENKQVSSGKKFVSDLKNQFQTLESVKNSEKADRSSFTSETMPRSVSKPAKLQTFFIPSTPLEDAELISDFCLPSTVIDNDSSVEVKQEGPKVSLGKTYHRVFLEL